MLSDLLELLTKCRYLLHAYCESDRFMQRDINFKMRENVKNLTAQIYKTVALLRQF